MSDLSEAIRWLDGYSEEEVDLADDIVLDAARRWDALTSPKNHRKAVIALQRDFGHDLHPNYLRIAGTVLRAVSEEEQ